MPVFLLLFFSLLSSLAIAQRKEKAYTVQPTINYTLTIDTAQHLVAVEMKLRNIANTFRLALYAHPEYNDRFWRYVKNLRVENGSWQREDSAVWQIKKSGDETIVRYTVQWPREGGFRPAWKPFLSATGGLVGGPHFYLYVVGKESSPSTVQLRIPVGWQTETALQKLPDSTTFFAPDVAALVDAPILVGRFKKWSFGVDGIPHTVAYWPSPKAETFAEDSLVTGIEKIVQGTQKLFGRLPYPGYHFLLMDDAYGALEHAESVMVGLPAADLAKDTSTYFSEIAHEYFHAWNLVRIHPVAFDGKVRYKAPPLAKELWWSEGATMYYADVLLRRAGLPAPEASRINHLKELLTQYYNSPGNYKLSPEKVSMSANAPNGMLGDYSAGPHLQGELIATLLDIFIRHATDGKKSLDDAMRKMAERFSGEKGFVSADVERIVSEICNRNLHPFFEKYIYKAASLPFNNYFKLIGLETKRTWKEAVGDDGKPVPDLEVYAWQKPSSTNVLLGLLSPTGIWGKAGLHTGDEILSLNGGAIKAPRDFYAALANKKPGDTLALAIKQKGQKKTILIVLSGYKKAVVTIAETAATEKAKRLQEGWVKAKE